MLTYPQFDPVAFSLGPLSVHWYGIMYIIAFGGAWFLGIGYVTGIQFRPVY